IPGILGPPAQGSIRGIPGLAYGSIRGITRLVGTGLEAVLSQLAPTSSKRILSPESESVLAALNGIVGDHLAATNNPLAIPMRLRRGGRPLVLKRRELAARIPKAGPKLLVLVHGLCMNDLRWLRLGHDHGAALARDLGFTPVYLHYNSGLHISANGREFAALLERLVAAWPRPLDELVIVAHSMGGLVARSACHVGETAAHAWRPKLRKLVCLGSPHHGAPLERGGHWIDLFLGASRYSAPLARLGKIRSAGVTDMRFGSVMDEHWAGHDRFGHAGDPRSQLELPDGVQCYAIAATKSRGAGGKLSGDGLVPVDSALGRHAKPELTLGFPETH